MTRKLHGCMLVACIVGAGIVGAQTMAGAVAVVDETGTVTRDEMSAMFEKLKQINTKAGLSLGVVVAGQMTQQAAEQKAKDQRSAMVAKGSLAQISGVFLFSGGQMTWQHDSRIDAKLTWNQALQVWKQIPPGPKARPNAIGFVTCLWKYFGCNKTLRDVGIAPVALPGIVYVLVCKSYDEVRDRIGPQNPQLTLGGEPLEGATVECRYAVNGAPKSATATTDAAGRCQFSVPLGAVAVTVRGETKTGTLAREQKSCGFRFGWQGHSAGQ